MDSQVAQEIGELLAVMEDQVRSGLHDQLRPELWSGIWSLRLGNPRHQMYLQLQDELYDGRRLMRGGWWTSWGPARAPAGGRAK